jgi:uncharacterized membrane protein
MLPIFAGCPIPEYMHKEKKESSPNGKKVKEVRDRPIKSIVKTITWRIIASTTTFFLAMFFFQSDPNAVEKATGVALAEAIVKMLLYYLHERAWAQLRWGRMMVVIRRRTNWPRRKIEKIEIVK